MTQMTCRVRAVSTRNIDWDAPKHFDTGDALRMRIPLARQRCTRTAQSASVLHTHAVFFVETLSVIIQTGYFNLNGI